MSANAEPRPLTILIAALGGEGGGALMNWIVAAARAEGLPVQATSVPGVAQRTGATSYYIEMLTKPAPEDRAPVFALMPMAGRVDIVLASELVEAGRMMERGFVSPQRTTLITSTSRVYATAEKIEMGDGRFAAARIEAAAAKLARRVIALDLDAIARQHATFISATLLGALAGSGALPVAPGTLERVIGTGRGAAESRAGFHAAMAAVSRADAAGHARPDPSQSQARPGDDPRVAHLPAAMREVAAHGLSRVVDYQDGDYGALYLERLQRLAATCSRADPDAEHAMAEAARRLALWMAYEDIPRVAELKIRPARFERIRREANVAQGQVLHVVEYLKPGAEEIAAMLPAPLGRRMMQRLAAGRSFPFIGRGLRLRSTGVFGYALLSALSRMKHLRRQSLRYADQQAAIEAWLAAMETALARAPAFAAALAELPRLLKGYSDTHVRGRQSYGAIMRQIVEPAIAAAGEHKETGRLRRAIGAALSDPDGRALAALLASDVPENHQLTGQRSEVRP